MRAQRVVGSSEMHPEARCGDGLRWLRRLSRPDRASVVAAPGRRGRADQVRLAARSAGHRDRVRQRPRRLRKRLADHRRRLGCRHDRAAPGASAQDQARGLGATRSARHATSLEERSSALPTRDRGPSRRVPGPRRPPESGRLAGATVSHGGRGLPGRGGASRRSDRAHVPGVAHPWSAPRSRFQRAARREDRERIIVDRVGEGSRAHPFLDG